MGLFEIVIVAVVTLLAVGPERMPEAVRSVALTVGRIKRMFQNARAEIEEHIGADDIRRQLHNEEIMAKVDIAREKMASTIGEGSQKLTEDQQTDSQTGQYDPPAPPLAKPATTGSTQSYKADPSS